ncbi:MAG: hypothetical protein AABO58_02550 [Acidobacteriota bacterium]
MLPGNEERFLTATEEAIEQDFLADYIRFGAQINAHTILTLLRAARQERDDSRRKMLCTACLQLCVTSIEDFAGLLQAIVQRKSGAYVHVTLTEDQGRGATAYPGKLKRPGTATELMEEVGFSTVNVERLRALGYDITAETFNDPFADFADSIKNLADYAEQYNDVKNRLKHGKCVFGQAFGLGLTDDIGNIATRTINGHTSRGLAKTVISLEQAEVASILVCKIVIVSLDLLSLFAVHYYPAFAEEHVHDTRDEGRGIAALARAAGLKSKGLTNLFEDEA